jgi:hypothetical protein
LNEKSDLEVPQNWEAKALNHEAKKLHRIDVFLRVFNPLKILDRLPGVRGVSLDPIWRRARQCPYLEGIETYAVFY